MSNMRRFIAKKHSWSVQIFARKTEFSKHASEKKHKKKIENIAGSLQNKAFVSSKEGVAVTSERQHLTYIYIYVYM